MIYAAFKGQQCLYHTYHVPHSICQTNCPIITIKNTQFLFLLLYTTLKYPVSGLYACSVPAKSEQKIKSQAPVLTFYIFTQQLCFDMSCRVDCLSLALKRFLSPSAQNTPLLFLSAAAFFVFLGNNIVLSKFIRRQSDIFCKLQIKVALGIITNHFRNAGDRKIRGDQQCLCLPNPPPQQILHRRIAAHLLKHM